MLHYVTLHSSFIIVAYSNKLQGTTIAQ